MIRIGKYKLGFATFSAVIVFIVLSICAVTAAFHNARPEWPMPLWGLIVVNESMALVGAIMYGVGVHFAIAIIDRLKKMEK